MFKIPLQLSKGNPAKISYWYVYWNRDAHNHNTRQTSHLHHGLTRTVRNCVRYSLPVFIDKTPNDVRQRVLTHSIDVFAVLAKSYALQTHEMLEDVVCSIVHFINFLWYSIFFFCYLLKLKLICICCILLFLPHHGPTPWMYYHVKQLFEVWY